MKQDELFYKYLIDHGLKEEIAHQAAEEGTIRHLEKGDMLLRMGEHTDDLCFIEKGLVRGMYINEDGNEVTKCFTTQNEWCCIYNMLHEEPSEFWIETLEDTTVRVFSVKKLKNMLETSSQLRDLFQKLFIQAYLKTEKRTLQFQKLSALERYESFRETYSEIEQRIPQQFIASYLGITASSLSRLRRQYTR